MVLQQKAKRASAFEGQKQISEMTTTEVEEMAIQKRRAEGTPCTMETFLAWKEKFDPEMIAKALEEENEQPEGQLKKKVNTVVATTGRITGFDFFSDKTNNLEALEAAAEEAGKIEDEEELAEDVNEELFDDDIDLDDLDFEDEEEEYLDI
jgi:hypothetical protein